MLIESPLTGVVAEVLVGEGDGVRAGAAVLVVEAMKMHHEVVAPEAGIVRELAIAVGEQVAEGQALFRVEAAGEAGGSAGELPSDDAGDDDALRRDLAEVLERTRLAHRRHGAARGGRQAPRDRPAHRARERRRPVRRGLVLRVRRRSRSPPSARGAPSEELIERTPADGIVTGDRATVARRGRTRAVLAYDYTVLAGTQGIRNHRKTDRLLELAERHRLPVVLFAEGGGGRPGDTDSLELFHLVVPSFHTFARLSGLVPRVGIVVRPLLRRQRRAARLLRRGDRDAGGAASGWAARR